MDDSMDAAGARHGPVMRVFEAMAAALSAVGTVWIAAMMLLIVADVIGRGFLNSPITGVAEVCARSVVAIVFLQLAAAVLSGRLTRADFMLRFVTARAPRAASLLEACFALAGAVVFAAIVHASWPATADAWRSNEYFGVRGVFTVPTLPFRAIIVVGAGLAAAASLAVALRHLARLGATFGKRRP